MMSAHGASRVSLRLVPLAGDGPLLSFGHFPLQGELRSAALTTHCVVIHYRRVAAPYTVAIHFSANFARNDTQVVPYGVPVTCNLKPVTCDKVALVTSH